jgi:hypothetical protein
MKIRIFSDIIGTSLYVNNRQVEFDILVKSAWIIFKLENLGLIPYEKNFIANLIRKYGDFGKIPSVHDFITNDMINDEDFKNNLDIKSIKIDVKKEHPRLLSTLSKYLLKKHNIDFN